MPDFRTGLPSPKIFSFRKKGGTVAKISKLTFFVILVYISLPIYQNHLTSKIKTTYRPKINFTVETKNCFCLDWNNGSTKKFVWMFMMTKVIISYKNCFFSLHRESTNRVWKKIKGDDRWFWYNFFHQNHLTTLELVKNFQIKTT